MAATDDVSTRTLGAITAVELAVPAFAAVVPIEEKPGKRMPLPLRYAYWLATTVMLDFGVVLLWKPQ